MRNWETLQRSEIKNILVIRLRSVAEILSATPLVKVLRNCFPEARIDFLLDEKFSELLTGCPFIDAIIPCHSKDQTIEGFFEIYRKVRKRRYDIVVDLQGGKGSRLLTFLSRAGFRLGYELPGWRSKAYNIKREVSPLKKHLVLSYLDLARELIDGGKTPLDLTLFVAQGEPQELYPRQNLREGVKKIFIHPGGKRAAKVWPVEKFAQLSDRLIQECGADVILAGSDAEIDRERVGRISRLMSGRGSIVYHSNLSQLISLLRSADIFVGSDNGPMHIAAALEKHVVALFGPSDPRVRHPWGSGHEVVWHKFSCSPCDRADCFKGDAGCITSIEVSEVLEAVRGFLA